MGNRLVTALNLLAAACVLGFIPVVGSAQAGREAVLPVRRTPDFTVDGRGSAPQWERAGWITLGQRATTARMGRNKAPAPEAVLPPARLSTRAKVLYSETGIYFLVQCEDRVLQATMEEDFMELWWEDVVEIFLRPDPGSPTYFEYQLSPLDKVRMTRHRQGAPRRFVEHKKGHRSLHETSVNGGEKKSGEYISQWTAEIMIPYRLLRADGPIDPGPGSRWRANIYRFDYDTGDRTSWAWSPVDGNNHNLEKFGTFLFQ